jgi:hypothetical protein
MQGDDDNIPEDYSIQEDCITQDDNMHELYLAKEEVVIEVEDENEDKSSSFINDGKVYPLQY